MPSKAWGNTWSQWRLDRRITKIQKRFVAARVMHNVDLVNKHYETMRSTLDEDGVRKLAGEGERAATIIEREVSGGQKLSDHLNVQIAAGVLDPADEEARLAAIDNFFRQKAGGLNSRATRAKNLVRLLIALALLAFPIVLMATDSRFDDGFSQFLLITVVVCWAIIFGIRLVQGKPRIFLLLVLRSASSLVLVLVVILCVTTVQALLLDDDGVLWILVIFIPGLPAALLLARFLWDERRSYRP